MRGMFFAVLLVTLFAIMFASQMLYNANQEDGIEFDIYNFTENSLVWNYSYININISEGPIKISRVENLVHKTVDWFGYSMFEVSKWAVEFGYTHPEYNFEYFFNFLRIYLYVLIVIAFAPVIVPATAIGYLICIGIKRGIVWVWRKFKGT